jgi:hypothetical protein
MDVKFIDVFIELIDKKTFLYTGQSYPVSTRKAKKIKKMLMEIRKIFLFVKYSVNAKNHKKRK